MWLSPGEAAPSIPRPNCFDKKSVLCVLWNQKGIAYYELMKPNKTVNAQCYQQQMISLSHSLLERWLEWSRKHGKKILLHNNAPSHVAKPVKDTLKSLGWNILPHRTYSPDLTPSDYHFFTSMKHALSEQNFNNFEEIGKWLDEWFAEKTSSFFGIFINY